MKLTMDEILHLLKDSGLRDIAAAVEAELERAQEDAGEWERKCRIQYGLVAREKMYRAAALTWLRGEECTPTDWDYDSELGAEAREIRAKLAAIACPDNAGGIHRFDWGGQCKDCCNYATNMIDRALKSGDNTGD